MNDMRKLMEAVDTAPLFESYWDWDRIDVSELKGKVFTEVEPRHGKTSLVFKTEDGIEYEMTHFQDCCESVWLEEVIGDLNDLVGSEIIEAEEVHSRAEDPPERYKSDEEDREYYGEYMVESYTWTFYKFGTMKGHVTLRWYGTSNGYYGETVYMYRKPTKDELN